MSELTQVAHDFHRLEIQEDVIGFVQTADPEAEFDHADTVSTSILAILVDIAASARLSRSRSAGFTYNSSRCLVTTLA